MTDMTRGGELRQAGVHNVWYRTVVYYYVMLFDPGSFLGSGILPMHVFRIPKIINEQTHVPQQWRKISRATEKGCLYYIWHTFIINIAQTRSGVKPRTSHTWQTRKATFFLMNIIAKVNDSYFLMLAWFYLLTMHASSKRLSLELIDKELAFV